MKNVSLDMNALKAALVRNRVKIFDLGFVVVLLSTATLFVFGTEVFEHEHGLTQRQETIDLNEFMLLAIMAMGSVLVYAWRRAREHRLENERRIAAEKEVMNLALQDPLTGLPNRRQFDAALTTALNSVPTAPEAHAVVLLDLNGFKKINDVHGHPIGDQVLIHVGARLLRAARDGDLVARLGGDEFAVLARNVAGAEGVTSIAHRIIDCLSEPVMIGGVRHTVATAMGVALSPQDGKDAGELIRRADVALYRAKTEKTSAVRFFEEQMDANLRERDALERALVEGLYQEEFIVRFEPTFNAEGRIVAFQAQPSWRHPTLGELPPERFTPIADEVGLLAALTEQLLRKACTAAASWPGDVRLAFGLPGALLNEPTFGLRILTVSADTHFSPNRLDLEIDEGALIREAEAGMALLKPLRSAGVSVVATHFGTGYSDLQNLHRLKLDGIKIDPSFVGAMVHDRQAAVIVKALIGIAQGLDLAVTADGVGTEEQKAALAAQGCEQGQGALFGAALDADAALALLAPPKRVRSAR